MAENVTDPNSAAGTNALVSTGGESDGMGTEGLSPIILPEVHASGLWSLKEPFSNMLERNTWYTCIAVRKMSDFVRSGINPYEEFYNKTYSIPETRYNEDVVRGGCIITVRSSTGDTFSFPSSYLLSFPAGGGVAYHSLILAIDIGALPESMDLSHLQAAVEEVVKNTLGVAEKAKLVNVGSRELVDRDTHKRYEAARQALIGSGQTLTSKNIALSKENEILKLKVRELEKHIINTAEAAP